MRAYGKMEKEFDVDQVELIQSVNDKEAANRLECIFDILLKDNINSNEINWLNLKDKLR